MRQRTIALFVALAIAGAACGSDSDSAGDLVLERSTPLPLTTDAAEAAEAADIAPLATDAPDQTAAETADQPQDEQVAEPAIESNPVTDAAVDALSTFAMDVDTGSYTYARGSLQSGVIPDPASVRTEEFVNSFQQDYAQPADGPFALTIDGTTAPFLGASNRVVRVGIQGRSVADADRRDADLTFVIDISGSMADPGKLDAVRPALLGLVESLRPTDTVGIVVYSDSTRVLLDATPVSERSTIQQAIQQLEPEGSTNVEDGLRLGYTQARGTLHSERINRVVLLSDGVANVGATGPEQILALIEDSARDGIDLVTVGFGLGDYNDRLMEQLADQGDGFYAYVDGEREAVRLFTHDLTGTLQTIAREAKVQVEFNPATVSTYRLVGFENRAVADDAFRDDSVDGGEVGAGHTVTALYEVSLVEGAVASGAWLARADIRWLDPDTSVASELSSTLLGTDLAVNIGDSPLRLQQDIYVAAFAESMRGSGWVGLISLDGLSENVRSIGTRLNDADLVETADLIDARIQLG